MYENARGKIILKMIIQKAPKNRSKNLCSDILLHFFCICIIMLYARFSPNFGSHFCKMDIFHFSKNVQNQKRPTNLDQPFFWGPYWPFQNTIILFVYIAYCMYNDNNTYNIYIIHHPQIYISRKWFVNLIHFELYVLLISKKQSFA